MRMGCIMKEIKEKMMKGEGAFQTGEEIMDKKDKNRTMHALPAAGAQVCGLWSLEGKKERGIRKATR